jgi:hypothetical protein
MLNPFPDLLALGFFAPTIVRIAAAAILLTGAYAHYKNKANVLAVAHAIVGGMLFLGWYTQYAALLGMLGIVFNALFPGRLRKTASPPWQTSLLLFAILFSLLISGAGAFAFDLPL